MQAYATRTGTRKNLAALAAAQWHLLVTPACLRTEGFPYALDNGAWTAYCQHQPWDEDSFMHALKQRGKDADWVVLPDIVAGGLESLELSLAWLPQVRDYTQHALLPVQDGMTPADIVPCVSNLHVGLFVGGSTAWKLATLPQWGQVAATHHCWLHVGRVNTAKRIRLCALSGVTSFDGTSVTRFAKTLPLLDHARRQLPLGKGLLYASTTPLDRDNDCYRSPSVYRA